LSCDVEHRSINDNARALTMEIIDARYRQQTYKNGSDIVMREEKESLKAHSVWCVHGARCA